MEVVIIDIEIAAYLIVYYYNIFHLYVFFYQLETER